MRHDIPHSDLNSSAAASSGGLPDWLAKLQPPDWVVDELQNRVVLFLNHVLMQEPQAQERLKRQKGKPVMIQWGQIHLLLAATPAGLLERVTPTGKTDLTVTMTQRSPLDIARAVLSGGKPAVDIQGDVQLAAEVAWLVDNVRWDVEEDLSRFVGDAAAHTLVRFAGAAVQSLRAFVGRVSPGGVGAGSSEPSVSAPANQDSGRPA